MKVLFDLENYLSDKPLGELACDNLLCPYGSTQPALFVEQVEDIKVVRVTNCACNDAGVEILLSSVDGLGGSDRIIIIGRLGQSFIAQGVGIALFAKDEKIVELSVHEPNINLYSLSCKYADIANQKLLLLLTKKSVSLLDLDFFIDGILVIREG